MATSLRCRVSAISVFCWPTTQTPSITSCLVTIVNTKPFIANCVPKLVAVATFLSTSEPPSYTWFLGPIWVHNPNSISIGSAIFERTQSPYTLQWDAPFPLKIAASHGACGPPSNTWFPGPTRVLNRNGILIASAVLQGLLLWQTTLLGW